MDPKLRKVVRMILNTNILLNQNIKFNYFTANKHTSTKKTVFLKNTMDKKIHFWIIFCRSFSPVGNIFLKGGLFYQFIFTVLLVSFTFRAGGLSDAKLSILGCVGMFNIISSEQSQFKRFLSNVVKLTGYLLLYFPWKPNLMGKRLLLCEKKRHHQSVLPHFPPSAFRNVFNEPLSVPTGINGRKFL